jgi:parvulin-like peptidyl-prolyl isomerase
MDLALHSQSELAQLFSAELAEAAFRLAEGQWSMPLPSAHGLHLIWVTARQPGQLPPLAQLSERLRLDVEESQQVQRRRQALDALRRRYQVVIERADR